MVSPTGFDGAQSFGGINTSGDERAVATSCRNKSYQDLLVGSGSKLLHRARLQSAEQFLLKCERSELAAAAAERVKRFRKRISKVSTISRYTKEGRVTEGWPCEVTNLASGESEPYFMTITHESIELRQVNLLRDVRASSSYSFAPVAHFSLRCAVVV